MINLPIVLYILYSFDFLIVSTNEKIISKKNYFNLTLLFSLILLLTYSGLHSDWMTYRHYVDTATYVGSTYFEKGFDFLCFLANKTDFEIIPIFSVCLFLYVCFQLHYNKICESNVLYALLVVSFYFAFLPLYFGALRQAVSTCFLILSLLRIVQGKKLGFLINIVFAILFHNSSLLIVGILAVFYIFFKIHRKKKLLIFDTIIVSAILFMIAKIFIANILSAIGLGYRFGYADDLTSSPLKDLFINGERLVFVFAGFLYLNNKNLTKQNKFHNTLCIMAITGSIFFIIFNTLMRNVAGRTLAFFRFSDVYLLYLFSDSFFYWILGKKRTPKGRINNVSLLVCIIYSLLKFYITVATSGVF